MIKDANPKQEAPIPHIPGKQTIELRSPDGSADIHSLLAGIAAAAQHGLEMEDALQKAEKTNVGVNMFKDENKERLAELKKLPASCWESAETLEKNRALFEKNGVFPVGMIDNTIERLKAYNDKDLSEKLAGKTEETEQLVQRFIHVM